MKSTPYDLLSHVSHSPSTVFVTSSLRVCFLFDNNIKDGGSTAPQAASKQNVGLGDGWFGLELGTCVLTSTCDYL